jgi:PPK2 family polyphosphate:nucleotide phosphotransferase
VPELQPKRIAEFIKPFRVQPGRTVRLRRDFDPGYTAGLKKKESGAKEILAQGVELLAEYQARLAAQDTHGVLVVLQAMDAAGKDGTIKHVMSGVNPQGVEVRSFKVPSAEELDHDYLWRYAKSLPARGHIGIFNRSYYEEVLVVRVHPGILDGQKLPPGTKKGDVWGRRFREINDWERYLADQGFRIVKLFLNVSREEQRRRFLARIDLAEKNWKFSANDAKERALWDDYQKAFEEVLSHTSPVWAPWYVIPADNKWFARVAAAGVIANALIDIDPQYPVVSDQAKAALQEAKLELEVEAPKGAPPDPIEAELAATTEAEAAAQAEAAAKAEAAAQAEKAAEVEATAEVAAEVSAAGEAAPAAEPGKGRKAKGKGKRGKAKGKGA